MIWHAQVADRENEMKKIVIAFSADGIEWSPWQVVWTDNRPVNNVTMKGDVDYPSLMTLEGNDNEVLLFITLSRHSAGR